MADTQSNPFQPPRPITPEMIAAVEETEIDPLLSFRPARTITRMTIFLVALLMVTDLLNLFAAYTGLEYLDRTSHGSPPSLNEYMRYAWLNLGLASFASLATIASVISFLVWMHQSYFNLQPLSAENRRFSPGWVILYWFIPIWNLYKPCQAMFDIWRGSIADDRKTFARRLLGLIILSWWLLLLSKILYSFLVFQQRLQADTIDKLEIAGYNQIALSIISIGVAVATIALVWLITTYQRLRYVKLSAESDRVDT